MQSPDFSIDCRRMRPGEERLVVDLVLKVFDEFIAPQYSQEGAAEFRKYVCVDALAERSKAGSLVLLAESGRKISGVIELRDKSHIALLFVKKSHQRRGIAKELVLRAVGLCRKHNPDIKRITVNSSPNAVEAYSSIGFRCIGNETAENGIRFIPMELLIDEKGRNPQLNSASAKKLSSD